MSALLTIPFDLIAILNFWRLENNLPGMWHAGYLRDEAVGHLKRILKGECSFGLEGWEERKRRATSLFRRYDEVLMKIPLDSNIPYEVLRDKEILRLLNFPYFNYCGGAALECGNYYFVFILFAEVN